jgi:hypothetical protein
MICRTVKHLVRDLQEAVPHIRGLVDAGIIDLAAFDYPGFNNGCEIIP